MNLDRRSFLAITAGGALGLETQWLPAAEKLAEFSFVIVSDTHLGRQDSGNKRTTGFFGASAAPLVPAANPFAVATAFTPSGTDADNVVKSDTAALYLQDQVAINPQWKVLAGVRHDRFSVH